MKRLLTYLGLLATLLAMPYHAKADNMYLRFWNNAEKVVEMNHDGGGTAWHYDFYTTDDYWKNNREIYVFPRVNNDDQYKMQSWQSEAEGENTSGTEYAFYKAGGNNKYDYKITLPTDYATKKYKVTVWVTNYNKDLSNPSCKVKVTWERADFNLQLKSSLDNWVSSTPSESSTGYTWTWDKSKLSGKSSGSKIYFKLYDADDDTSYGPGSSDTEATSSWQSCVGGDHNWYVTYSKGNTYTIDAQRVNGTWQVKVTTNEEDHDYYWVSPQVTNNQKWPYFKLTALRNRSGDNGDGKISDKYFTFTIKNDDLLRYDGTAIDDGDLIEWYIARDDDAVWFRPSEDDPTTSDRATSLNIGREKDGYSPWDSNIGYRNYLNCKVTDKSNTYKFAFKKGANSTKTSESDYLTNVKSYTFILNAKTSSDATKGNVFFNYAHNSDAVTSGDCYLLGNFRSASESESVCNPWDPKYVDENTNPYGPRKMTKYWYVGDTKYESQQTPCDSIVYEIKVNKPAAGWGNLYLDINPGSNTSWNRVYRPLISLGNTLDGRALIGGLTTAGAYMAENNGKAGDQSLNPETSNDYTSYTFRFNATTYTYRLEFHTSLYLVGPGVSATKEKKGSWVISDPSTSDPRIRLTATQEKDHYRNLVYFTNGKQFRFIKNTDESATPNYKYTWYENDNKPKWKSAASDGEYYPDNETQFRNYMKYENGTGPEPTDGDQSMTFDLPDGWYYVNFYPNAGKPYYTIEHSMELRDFNEVYYRSAAVPAGEVRKVEGRNDYNFLRVWSDHIAWNKPDNIDVFVVSEFDHNANTTTATLRKLNIDYIPAKTGVILGCKLSKDNLTSGLVYNNAATLAWDKGEYVNYYNTLTAELTPYSAPSTSYTDGESKLIPLYEETELKRFSNEDVTVTGETYANYLFGFYRRKKYVQNYTGDDKIFDLGFWLTTGEGKTYANSAFLHLTKAQAEDLGVGTAYDNIESASAPAFMLLFDESDDNVITGISDITTAKGNSVASQGWYTLQGVRTAKPTQRGIYIYNGKKVIVND